MTEAEWLASESWWPLLKMLNGKMSGRKCRLFACACCRYAWESIQDDSRAAVEVAERFADAEAVGIERMQAEEKARRAYHTSTERQVGPAHAAFLSVQVRFETYAPAQHVESSFNTDYYTKSTETHEACKQIAARFRDIFGNPFRPLAFSSEWRTDTAVSLARTMYESRDFSAMPILADALQDAVCDNEDILAHCRDGNLVHVRGCWVCDLVLGKS